LLPVKQIFFEIKTNTLILVIKRFTLLTLQGREKFNFEQLFNYETMIQKKWQAIILTIFIVFISCAVSAQAVLKEGFDPKEYLQLIEIYHQQGLKAYQELYKQDTVHRPQNAGSSQKIAVEIPFPEGCRLLYQSPETGLYNSWELWMRNDSVAVISIRGTVMKVPSWLENFYSAMVPAEGSLQLNDSTIFTYKLAEDKRATVHVGWLTGMASMAPDIVLHIRKLYQKGVHNFILTGHSQGGAITFLLSSYLHHLSDSILPGNICYKVYCSAAPKPGNLYYAYDFDHAFMGWAYRVVNTQDWVPETPLSVQTLDDINAVNPFANVEPVLKKQKWLARIFLQHAYNNLNKSLNKANRVQRKYLGKDVFRQIHKLLPELKEPVYANSVSYMPAGIPVILTPYPGYEKEFEYDGKNVFINHDLRAYYELVLHDYAKKNSQ
jgi:predicted lipase